MGSRADAPLLIDGAHGEGGGQILRSALSLAVITGRPLRIERIRANRRKPGLAAQHLTAVRAAAALCGATLSGDALGSRELDFIPRAPVSAGDYAFDVALARDGGSAGAVTLVLQTVLLPLAFAAGRSSVVVRGGTHLPQSPPVDYLCDVWLPMLNRLGVCAGVALEAWGWFPVGKGEIHAVINGSAAAAALEPLDLVDRGALRRVKGRAVAANLPAHIPQRMADRASSLLETLGAALDIRPERVRAVCPGAGIFLTAEYEHASAGFSCLGAVGKPSEAVAEEATTLLLHHHASGAAFDRYLGDQLLLPLCFARGPSRCSIEAITRHFETNLWFIEQFGVASVLLECSASGTGTVTVMPHPLGGTSRSSASSTAGSSPRGAGDRSSP